MQADAVLRAITDDGAFRIIIADTTHTVRGALEAQKANGEELKLFGDLVTATVLFRETMAPQFRVQGILKTGKEHQQLVADSHPSGNTRGLIQRGKATSIGLDSNATLRMMRTLPGGQLNQGIVAIPPQGGVSAGMMAYMHDSEQIVTMVAMSTLWNETDTITHAGGYLVQLLPGAPRPSLMIMTERLRDFENIDPLVGAAEFSTEKLLDELLYGMPYTKLESTEVRYACWCDELRVVSALATLSKDDLKALLAEQHPLEISCDYCGKSYQIHPSQLRGLIETS